MSDVRGVQGYDESLISKYEALRFEEVHASVSHLFPRPPGDVLDIGAGTGRDAAAFTKRGYRVTAVEPCKTFRRAGRDLHPSSIRWVDDSLPELASLSSQHAAFDIIMATAVWMHLDDRERLQATKQIALLLKPGGRFFMSMRHGSVPEGRIMFDVSSEETISLAASCGLKTIFSAHEQSLQPENRHAGVTWSKLVFEKPAS